MKTVMSTRVNAKNKNVNGLRIGKKKKEKKKKESRFNRLYCIVVCVCRSNNNITQRKSKIKMLSYPLGDSL